MVDRKIRTVLVMSLLASPIVMVNVAIAQQPKKPVLAACTDDSEGCTAQVLPTTQKKWNPGHYVKTQGQICDSDQSAYYSGVRNNLNTHVESSNALKGALIIYAWGALETNNGNYDWTRLNEHLNWLAQRDKKLLAVVSTKCNGTQDPEWSVPKNLEGQVAQHKNGITAALWRQPVMDQAIQFWRAFAREFDGHPALEMVAFGAESCPSWQGNPPPDYDHDELLEQQVRLYRAMSKVFQQTVVGAPWNCSQGGTIVKGMEAVHELGLGHTSPDAHDDFGNMAFRGEQGAKRDYRGKIAHRTIVSQPNLGGKDDIMPLSNIQWLIDVGKMTHVAWVMSSKKPGGTKSDILAHIENPENQPYKSCPTRYQTIFGGCK